MFFGFQIGMRRHIGQLWRYVKRLVINVVIWCRVVEAPLMFIGLVWKLLEIVWMV